MRLSRWRRSDVATWVLISGCLNRVKGEIMWWWKQRLQQHALKMELVARSKGMQVTPRPWERPGNKVSSPSLWKEPSHWHLDLSPVKLIADFWLPELQENKFGLFQAVQLMVIHNSSNRHWRQHPLHFHSSWVKSKVITRTYRVPHHLFPTIHLVTQTSPPMSLSFARSFQPLGLLASNTRTCPLLSAFTFTYLVCSFPKIVTWFDPLFLGCHSPVSFSVGLSWQYYLKSECISFEPFYSLYHLPPYFFQRTYNHLVKSSFTHLLTRMKGLFFIALCSATSPWLPWCSHIVGII